MNIDERGWLHFRLLFYTFIAIAVAGYSHTGNDVKSCLMSILDAVLFSIKAITTSGIPESDKLRYSIKVVMVVALPFGAFQWVALADAIINGKKR